MERKAEKERALTDDPMKEMQIRMLKTDASPMKKRLAAACSKGKHKAGFDVWLHIYDLGPLSKWFLNGWNSKQSGLGAFHCGIEVLGVEWSFQAMIDCETDEMTGVMCHTPKSHPRHVYRESMWLGGSPLCANEICNVLARLERDWPARSYHFLSHNCTDFAEALATNLNVPNSFPSWAHGLAKGLLAKPTKTSGKAAAPAPAPWWLPAALGACCGSGSGSWASRATVAESFQADSKAHEYRPCSASAMMPSCDEFVMAPKVAQYPHA
jgi:hypothetical protein